MIKQYTDLDLKDNIETFADLLIDVVENGASIGFLPPLSREDALVYWQSRLAGMKTGEHVLLVAHRDGEITGCVQLALEQRLNGNHRAEVQKLMVHTAHRRQGIGRELMTALEQFAISDGRTTLVLDTRHGDPSEQLYQSMDYVQAGIIPQYARSADGTLHSTVFYYKLLD